jgi:linoleoyl-CoA desaturase
MNQVAGAGSGSAESSKARKTPPLLFPRATEFQAELRRRVDAYFQTTGKRSRDLPTMYLKTAFILAWFGVSYGLLVFHHNSWLESVLLATSLGLAMAGIGFNVAHDACHGAFSKVPFINELFSVTLDMLGGSSYVWKWKHNFFHHTYTNVVGADDDIDFGFVARLAPEVPLRGLQK